MRLSKMKFLKVIVISLVLSLLFTASVYSDSQNGWKGYGLYNINNSKITIMSENVSIEIKDTKLKFNGEYVIRNTTNSEIRVVLGMPTNGIEAISLMEKGYYDKWKKRSLDGLQSEFNTQNQLPPENSWYTFNLTLNPAETRVINVSLDAAQQFDTKGIYSVSYFSDRKQGYSNKVEKSALYIKIDSFEPYDILSVKGFDPNEIGKKGDIYINSDEKNIEAVALEHISVVGQAVDKLMRSPMHKAREIALAFLDKNYDSASSLCDEYLKNPSDNQISKEQIIFIKAESLRRLYNFQRYLELVEPMDYSKLYPAELKNKIYLDRMNVYLSQENKDKVSALTKELSQQNDESTEFLSAWMENSGYYNLSESDKSNPAKENGIKEENSKQPLEILLIWYLKTISLPYTPIIIFAAGLITGLLLRRRTAKRKKRKSMYIYRM